MQKAAEIPRLLIGLIKFNSITLDFNDFNWNASNWSSSVAAFVD